MRLLKKKPLNRMKRSWNLSLKSPLRILSLNRRRKKPKRKHLWIPQMRFVRSMLPFRKRSSDLSVNWNS